MFTNQWIMVEGLHAVDEGQDQVPDLLLVAVVVPQVDVVGRLVQEDGSLDDLPDEVEHIKVDQDALCDQKIIPALQKIITRIVTVCQSKVEDS